MVPLTAEGLSGFLLSSEKTVGRDDLKAYSLGYVDAIGPTKWERYSYRTTKPIFGEDEHGIKPPYPYPVVCRRSGNRVVLMASKKDIIEQLLKDTAGVSLDARLRKVAIAVDDLVKSISRKPGPYSLSYVHARLAAFGSSVRSVSFYGEDVTDAKLFSEHSDVLNCFGCGLHHVVYGYEVIRLGSDGAASCASSAQLRLRLVESALNFVSTEGFLR